MRRSPLFWSVRREVWENRSVYMGPLLVALVVLGAFVFHLPKVDSRPALLPIPFGMGAAAILFTGMLVAFFYCLDALHAERRDRSILFWKSMPVSDLTTVASKALVPLAIVPLTAAAIALATQLAMVIASSIAFAMRGEGAALPWSLPWGGMTAGMLYGLAVHALWFAPTYGYLTVVSALARRANFLWAVLPFVAAFVVEKLALGTSHVARFVSDRFTGAMPLAFAPDALKSPITQLDHLTPLRFLASPALWIGLAAAVAFFALAVWLRRRRDPI